MLSPRNVWFVVGDGSISLFLIPQLGVFSAEVQAVDHYLLPSNRRIIADFVQSPFVVINYPKQYFFVKDAYTRISNICYSTYEYTFKVHFTCCVVFLNLKSDTADDLAVV